MPYREIRNGPAIEVLRRALAREEEKIERAREEIVRIRLELQELGSELPAERLIAR